MQNNDNNPFGLGGIGDSSDNPFSGIGGLGIPPSGLDASQSEIDKFIESMMISIVIPRMITSLALSGHVKDAVAMAKAAKKYIEEFKDYVERTVSNNDLKSRITSNLNACLNEIEWALSRIRDGGE